MKNIIHLVRNHVVLLLLAPIVGLAALLLVHLLPTEPMQQHVYWSIDMIEQEFTDELIIDGHTPTLTGSFTDSMMLHYAIYSNDEHNTLEQVLRMYRSESCNDVNNPDGWWPGYSLMDYLEKSPQPREVEYSRYWHGYLVILKPLLLLTSFNTIRLLNSAVQLIAIGLVVMGLCQKNAYPVAKAFLVSIPFLFFVSTYASLSLSICLYVVLFALLVQLKWDNVLTEKNLYNEYFLIIGTLTSFFDLLTYPLITLAYPLCVYLFFHGKDWKHNVKKIMVNSVEWFVGYMGMWGAKWILADLFTDSTTIRDAINTITTRTQGVENTSRLSGFWEVISENLSPFYNWCYLLIGLVPLLFLLASLIKNDIKKVTLKLSNGVPYFLVALYPFVWYFVTQNHSIQHWQFTCRIMAVTVFAGILGMNRLFTHKNNP